MSVLFYSIAKQAITPIVKPLEFRCRGRFYHRIIDNVVQQFCLLWLNHDFTIRFNISSVYADNDRLIEGNEVAKIINGSNNMWLGQRLVQGELQQQFSLQGTTASLFPHYIDCANTCVDVLINYLIPWFEKACNSASAYKMAKDANIFLTIHQEPDSYESLGFLLDQQRWKQSAALIKYYLDNSHLYNQKWWIPREQEYQQLYEALVNMDTAYIKQYMDGKKSATYRLFRYKL